MIEHIVQDALSKMLREVQTIEPLVLIVGTGVSLEAGVPTWQTLLTRLLGREGGDRTVTREDIRSLEGREEEVARLLRQALADAQPSSTHQAIAELRPRAILTTNYDTLLEKALLSTGQSPKVVTPDTTWEGIDSRSVPIIKLHGSIDRPSLLQLTRAAGPELLGAIRSLVNTSTVIAIGFSPDERALAEVYERFGGENRSQPWFVLVDSTDVLLQSLWRSRGVEFLQVPSDKVRDLLRQLAIRNSTKQPAPRPSSGPRVFVMSQFSDEAAITSLQAHLRALGLIPVRAEDAWRPGDTVAEAIDRAISSTSAAVVLLGTERRDREAAPQRTNIIFELGLLVGRLGRDRVLVLAPPGTSVPGAVGGMRYLFLDTTDTTNTAGELARWADAMGLSQAQ